MRAGPTICPGNMTRDVFDSTATLDGLLFYRVFKFTGIILGKSPLLGDVDLLAARELELGPAEVLNQTLPVLQLGADGHFDLPTVPWGFQRLFTHLSGG